MHVKVNSSLFYEDVWGSGGLAPLFFTSALDGREWSPSRLNRFSRRGETSYYPLDRTLCGIQCRREKSLAPVGNRTPVAQFVDSCYTD
jgi:hypothetical protein